MQDGLDTRLDFQKYLLALWVKRYFIPFLTDKKVVHKLEKNERGKRERERERERKEEKRERNALMPDHFTEVPLPQLISSEFTSFCLP